MFVVFGLKARLTEETQVPIIMSALLISPYLYIWCLIWNTNNFFDFFFSRIGFIHGLTHLGDKNIWFNPFTLHTSQKSTLMDCFHFSRQFEIGTFCDGILTMAQHYSTSKRALNMVKFIQMNIHFLRIVTERAKLNKENHKICFL